MFICYIDESGQPELPGNTSHYILAGIMIPIWKWKTCDSQIRNIKTKYSIRGKELHTGWILRKYFEQSKIPDFSKLEHDDRIYEVNKLRHARLLSLQRSNKNKQYHQLKKTYRKTEDYIHLTFDERQDLIYELATMISKWQFARLFAECIDKIYFDPRRSRQAPAEQAFEQIVSRFEQYLSIRNKSIRRQYSKKDYGMIIHDNNPTVEKKLTNIMKSFQQKGTFWTDIENIVETPLFVDSQLTSMVQIADICAYSLRRYLENGETRYFNEIFKRADKKNGMTVGIRHFSKNFCNCLICKTHSPQKKHTKKNFSSVLSNREL